MTSNVTEREVAKVWRNQLLDRTGLSTEEGEPIEIVYPGRANDDRGADFRDAVIATSQGVVKGNIEVHVKSSDWRGHQHHRDKAYNGVVLHVVMWHNTGAVTSLQNGAEIPILCLDKYVKVPVAQLSNRVTAIPCGKAAQGPNTDTTLIFLDQAGDERFSAKADEFQRDLVQTEVSQVLYQGIMRALGYSKNKLPFLELALSLPLQTLEAVNQSVKSDDEYLAQQQALLFGTAGLLPSQRLDRVKGDWWNDAAVDKLERLWASSHHTRAMSPFAWHLFKVRPSNSPVRRLVAMSYLLLRYREKGMLGGLVNLIQEVPVKDVCLKLEEGLLVTAEGYWASHSDFGSKNGIRNTALLGRGRAADIAVNVLLPFTFAWSRFVSYLELGEKVMEIYRHYPRLAINSVEKHMAVQLGLSSRLVNSARRQQGLIHVYNTLCTQGKCSDCQLGQLETRDDIQV